MHTRRQCGVEALCQSLRHDELSRDLAVRWRRGLEDLQQPAEEGDEVGPFVDTFKRLETPVDLGSELLVLCVTGKEGGGGGWGRQYVHMAEWSIPDETDSDIPTATACCASNE